MKSKGRNMENNQAGKAADVVLQYNRKINGFQILSMGVPHISF